MRGPLSRRAKGGCSGASWGSREGREWEGRGVSERRVTGGKGVGGKRSEYTVMGGKGRQVKEG